MASDNASVMVGNHNSFMTRLKKKVSVLIVLRCICHSCENILHAVATYFSGSAKRSAILFDFQEFFGVESRKILKLSGTRCRLTEVC